jgi:hypothetical protein
MHHSNQTALIKAHPTQACAKPGQSLPPLRALTFQRSLASVTNAGSTGSCGLLLLKALSTDLFTCSNEPSHGTVVVLERGTDA